MHGTLEMTYMAVKFNFQQVLLKTLIPTMNTLKDMAVLNIIKTDGKCEIEIIRRFQCWKSLYWILKKISKGFQLNYIFSSISNKDHLWLRFHIIFSTQKEHFLHWYGQKNIQIVEPTPSRGALYCSFPVNVHRRQ